MAALTDDESTRAATNAAEQLVDAYYSALNSTRGSISSYYMPMTVLPSGRTLPLITYNGQQSSDPDAFQKTYEEQMPFTHYEVQSLNAHVMNSALAPLDDSLAKGKGRLRELESNMSVLVQVSGYVRLMERKEGPMRGFSDTFVIVPNKETGAKGRGRAGEGRAWVIQSQNFRFVV